MSSSRRRRSWRGPDPTSWWRSAAADVIDRGWIAWRCRTRVPVRMLGRVPDDDLAELYGCADVFAMLCRNRWGGLEQEGFGIVFLEAAACGVPQVAGDSGGAAEAVADGETGLVVDRPSEVSAVTAALARLLDDPERRRAMGAAAVTGPSPSSATTAWPAGWRRSWRGGEPRAWPSRRRSHRRPTWPGRTDPSTITPATDLATDPAAAIASWAVWHMMITLAIGWSRVPEETRSAGWRSGRPACSSWLRRWRRRGPTRSSPLSVPVDLVLFAAGCGAFLWAYVLAIGRSRYETITMGGLFFLGDGVAPPDVTRLLRRIRRAGGGGSDGGGATAIHGAGVLGPRPDARPGPHGAVGGSPRSLPGQAIRNRDE